MMECAESGSRNTDANVDLNVDQDNSSSNSQLPVYTYGDDGQLVNTGTFYTADLNVANSNAVSEDLQTLQHQYSIVNEQNKELEAKNRQLSAKVLELENLAGDGKSWNDLMLNHLIYLLFLNKGYSAVVKDLEKALNKGLEDCKNTIASTVQLEMKTELEE